MITDRELVQRLNLLRNSKTFVLRQTNDQGEAEVLCVSRVPKDSGLYWIAGETAFANGAKVPSIFRVDTNSGGTLAGAYWWVDGSWYDQQDKDALGALGLTKADAFPYDWTYHVLLEEDIYHD